MFASLIGTRFARKFAALATTALTTAAASGVSLASGNALTLAKLYDFVNSVDPAYMASPKARIGMHRKTWSVICQLEDSNGNLVFRNLVDPMARRFIGIDVVFIEEMPEINTATAGQTIAVIGDFDSMWLRTAGPMRIVNYNELYAKNDLYGMVAFQRFGVFQRGPVGSLKYLKMYQASSMSMTADVGLTAKELLRG